MAEQKQALVTYEAWTGVRLGESPLPIPVPPLPQGDPTSPSPASAVPSSRVSQQPPPGEAALPPAAEGPPGILLLAER